MLAADGKVVIDSKVDDKGVDKGLKDIQSKLTSTGKKLKSIGSSMTKNLTLPIVAAGTGAILMAAKFDDSMRKVKSTMGTNLGGSTKEANKNFKELRAEALKLGATTAHSANDASAAMKELAQMGYDTNMILASTGTVLDVASASGLALDFVASTLAGTMNQFGVEVDANGVNIKRFGDVMVRAGQMSGTSMEEIAKALEYVGSSANLAGMDIEQISAYIGVLGDNNIKSSKAGTSLNAMLRDMKAKVKDNELAFGDFNVAMYDGKGNMRDMTDIMLDLEKGLKGKTDAERDAAIAAIFGSESQVAVNALMSSGTDILKKYEGQLNNANEAASIAAGEMEGGIGGAFRALKSATEGLAIAFGDVLAPVINKIAQVVAQLFLKFISLSDGTKRIVVAVLAVIAAIGPLLTVIGTLLIVVPALVTAISTFAAPIGIAIGVIASLIAIGVLLYQNWDTVKQKAVEVFSQFSPLLDIVKTSFQSLKDSVTPIMNNLKTLWQSLIPILQLIGIIVSGVVVSAFGILVGVFNGVISALGPLINAFLNFVQIITNTVSAIVILFTGDFAGAFEYIKAAATASLDFFINAFTAIKDFIMGFVEAIISFFYNLYIVLVGNSIIPDMVREIVDWFKNMLKWVIDLVKDIVSGVKSAFTTMRNAISSVMNSIRSVISSIWNTIKSVVSNVVNSIRSTISSVFNNIRSVISSVMNAVRSVISSVWNGIRSVISSVVNSIRNTISNIFNSLGGIVSSAMSRVKSAVSTGITGALSVVTGMAKRFYNAGRNIVTSIASGITSAVGKVKDAIGGVAKKIRNFLPFSPAKEGPLQDINKLNFGGPIQDSMDAAIPDIQSKLNTMLRVPNIKYQGNKKPKSGSNNINSNNSGDGEILISGNTFNIREEADIKKVARELYKLEVENERG